MKILKWADCKTDADRWRYHSQVYAWRIFRGWAPATEQTSPVDKDGDWFNPVMIKAQLDAMRAEHPPQEERQAVVDEENRRAGRALCDEWARSQGFADFDAAYAAEEARVAGKGINRCYSQAQAYVSATYGTLKRLDPEPGQQLSPSRKERLREEALRRAHEDAGVEVSEAAE